MDVRGTITLSDEAAVPSLLEDLRRTDCAVERTDRYSVEFTFDWGDPDTGGDLSQAWSNLVFFLHTWQARHGEVVIDLEDVRFEPPTRVA